MKKPSFSPPGWVFPVVWTGLYTAMGIAKYRASVRKPTIALQLGLNFLWSFLFFRCGLRGTAFVEMVLMLGAITWTAYEFHQADTVAGRLMMSYAAWVAFALGLNYSI
ncbi:TspO/MBR family protein [Domibacillus sp.]|uniref:TspO/MBR family protein n=1 Tax=Domibacillus sp. TaxID=1969783 RepID=UPI00281289C3|nr:TspO/MBR family protein [Domibacillus sp.]